MQNSKARQFEARYGQLIDMVVPKHESLVRREWTDHDTNALGSYLENVERFQPAMESVNTSRNGLGPSLEDNLGLVALSYASLPMQPLASIQPLNDEVGSVHFRRAVASTSRGDVTAGDILISDQGGINAGVETFVSEAQTRSIVISDVSAPIVKVNLGKNLRPTYLKLSVAGGKVKGMDDGEGYILGVNIDSTQSTINYETGEAEIVFMDLASKGVSNGDTLDISYTQSVIDSDEIPSMKWMIDSKAVRVTYDVLQSEYSSISEVILRNRFGTDLGQMVQNDIVTQINSAVMFRAIRALREAAIANEAKIGESITWSMKAPVGVSDSEHRRTFDDKLIEAVDFMYRLAQRGEVSTIVVGTRGKQILTTAGMEVIKNSVAGPHLCGMYGEVPVYYAPNTAIGRNEMLVSYRGTHWYESPLVYAPFLPVTSVSAESVRNVLMNTEAAYHAAAVSRVNDGFVIRINLEG